MPLWGIAAVGFVGYLLVDKIGQFFGVDDKSKSIITGVALGIGGFYLIKKLK